MNEINKSVETKLRTMNYQLRTILLVTSYLLLTNFAFAQYWEPIAPGSPPDIRSMTCDINGHIWVGTESGNVYLYDGAKWNEKGRVSLLQGHITSIAVALNGDIYVCRDLLLLLNRSLYKSTDGGDTWTSIFNTIITSRKFSEIVISSSGSVYFITDFGVYRPNGTSWTFANVVSGDNITALTLAPNGTTLYAGTEGSGVYRSTNGGVSWQPSNTHTTARIHKLTVVNNDTLFAAADLNGILKSTNGGESWNRCDPIHEFNTSGNNIMYNSKTDTLFADIDGADTVCNAFISNDLGKSWKLQNDGLNKPVLGPGSFTFNPITGETYLKNHYDAIYRYVPGKPIIKIEPTIINFGNVKVANQSTKSFKITNEGSADLIISQVSITGDGFSLTSVSTPIIIQPNSSSTIEVQFSPTDVTEYSGTITLTHNTEDSLSVISLQGTGFVDDVRVTIKKDYTVKPSETIKVSVDVIDDLTDKNAKSFLFVLQYNKRILSFKDHSLTGTISNSLSVSTTSSTPGELRVEISNPTDTPLSGTGSLIDINFTALRGDSCGTHLVLESFAFNSDGPNAITEDGYCKLYGGCGEEHSYVTTDMSTLIFQNIPNPVQSGYDATINYRLNNDGTINLTVYDVLGREVTRLINEYKVAGTYSVTFNTKGLSSGVYFYKLRAPGYEGLKKMVIVH